MVTIRLGGYVWYVTKPVMIHFITYRPPLRGEGEEGGGERVSECSFMSIFDEYDMFDLYEM